jgi:hypothetical protein
MTAYLIRMRFLQLYRSSGELGLFRVLLLAVVIVPLLALFVFQRVDVHPWPFVFPAAVLFILWLIHSRRKDYHFLSAILPKPQLVFFAEYFLFSIPFTALLLWAALYLHALVFLALMILIAFLVPAKTGNSFHTIKLPWIPAGMFEWQSGIRKNLPAMVLFYFTGFIGVYHPGFSAGSLLILTLVFTSFYSEYEPGNMLRACACRPLQFLWRKLVMHTGYFALLLLPLLFIALVNSEYRWLTLGYFLASLNLVVFSVLLKYYQYRPGAFSGAHQMLTTLACFISVVLPVMLFIALFNIFLAWGAARNLKTYLDDFN